jgi:alginate O-acetyltransferase complex protein AlgI
MLFPTVDFAIFFAVVFLGHWLLNPHPLRWKLFMIGASYVFYAWWNVHFVWLLAAVSAIAQLSALTVARQTDARMRRWAMGIGVALTFAPLFYFKYAGFLSVNLTNGASSLGMHLPLPLIQVTLPVGVSFFTFMAVAYVVDVYRGQFEVASWIDALLYLSFFPHLVAGPIVRPAELIPQLDIKRDPRHVDVAGAAYLIFGGLFKKVVVSSYLATAMVDPVFADPARHSAIEVVLAAWAYAVVIYADFSGYTDIAIGIAKLLGFQFPQNFDRPYSAVSLQDFWRRWHMTLSRWLRDYLYIPLGGSKKGEART